MKSTGGNSTSGRGAGIWRRLVTALTDPANLFVPVVIVLFWAMRGWGLIAPLAYWQLAALGVAAPVATSLATALWGEATAGPRLVCRVGVEMAAIATVIYGVGWGPILAIGFVFGAADVMRGAGAAGARPAIAWTVVWTGIGQLAVFLGLVHSLIGGSLVQGLGALELLGAVATIKVLEWFAVAREASEGRFGALVQHATDILVVLDHSNRLSYVSPSYARIMGGDATGLEGGSAADLLHPDDLAGLRADVTALWEPGDVELRREVRLRHADGGWRCFEATITNHRDDPRVGGIVANLHDITARKQAEVDLAEAHAGFRSAFENAPIGMGLTDLEGRFFRVNPALARIVGRSAEELCGMTALDITHPDDRHMTTAERQQLVAGRTDRARVEKRYVHASGDDVWVAVNISCVRDDAGHPRYLIGQVEDVTERRRTQESLAHAAIHDALTALPNRTLFMDRLETALGRTGRGGGQVAVVFLDLDRFKAVNDTLGHDGGDEVLQAVARRIRSSVRPSDTVARLGGDEFTVVCDPVLGETEALALAERIAASLRVPIDFDGTEVFVTASLGVALGRHPVTAEEMVRNADTAMYLAKERGRASIEVFDPAGEIATVGRLRTTNELRVGIEAGQLELHYQPFVRLDDERVVAVEALVRWRHPTRGLLLPGDFIELAEDTGLIGPLGRFVLCEGFRQTAAWQRHSDAAGDGARHSISVNVSPRQLADRKFAEQVAAAVAESGVDPDVVWLEITENTLLQDPDLAIGTLRALRDQGLHVSIDDFGTGYSSLGYLQRLPVECLKIDRTFVDGLGRNAESTAIVRAVLALAESLGLFCLAEGVESASQARQLRELGCELAQGYHFGRPRPARDLGPVPSATTDSWSDPLSSATA